MPNETNDTSSRLLIDTISGWLNKHLDHEAYEWLMSTFQRLQEGGEDWDFFSSFSSVPRHTGKDSLKLTSEEIEIADEIRSGWQPQYWSLDQLGRTFLVLSIIGLDKESFLERIEKLFISSDMGETAALYQSLPILPYPDDFKKRTAEGLRTNITPVFNVIAHHNPYPADYLDESAWNQMVLKALFVGSSLYQIQGLDRRANKVLAKMLVEYAHERWSAGRRVSPELWRPVGPFIQKEYVDDLKKVLNDDEKIQQQAALLALSSSELPEAQDLLNKHTELAEATIKTVTWDMIGKENES